VIVRIATEGQYEVAEVDVRALNDLDNEAVSACAGEDEAHFREVYDRMLAFVRAHGRPVPDEELSASDIILPPPDVSLAEARDGFSDEGLIPG
jgi:hypothetical protein